MTHRLIRHVRHCLNIRNEELLESGKLDNVDDEESIYNDPSSMCELLQSYFMEYRRMKSKRLFKATKKVLQILKRSHQFSERMKQEAENCEEQMDDNSKMVEIDEDGVSLTPRTPSTTAESSENDITTQSETNNNNSISEKPPVVVSSETSEEGGEVKKECFPFVFSSRTTPQTTKDLNTRRGGMLNTSMTNLYKNHHHSKEIIIISEEPEAHPPIQTSSSSPTSEGEEVSISSSTDFAKRRRNSDTQIGEEETKNNSSRNTTGGATTYSINNNSYTRGMNKRIRQNNAPSSSSSSGFSGGGGGGPPNASQSSRGNGGGVKGFGEEKKSFQVEILPDITLKDMGGVDNILSDIRELVIRPLEHPEVFNLLGVKPPRGILLHGPPGSGKTQLAWAIAGEAQVPFFKVAGPELVSGMSGESESMLRSLFQDAKLAAPSLIFIDEIDAITPKRDTAAREMERRIVAQLGACMDEIGDSFVIVLGATNRIDALDVMIRRNGRFDREIPMGLPDEKARKQILEIASRGLKISDDVDFDRLAQLTPGFVGADLYSITREASLGSIARVFDHLQQTVGDGGGGESSGNFTYSHEQLAGMAVGKIDFEEAVKKVQPSAQREGFATIPDVSWNDVGALGHLRKELEDSICSPVKEPHLYKKLGLDVPTGVLLYGPPGCGKTLLAKAVAKESGANFISVKGPELLNKYVGESEKAVRQVFQRARVSAPCVIFFDELDSLCTRRASEGNQATERVVNQLLTEMDGVDGRRNVYVVAATNRPDIIDPAMLRPGRLDKLLYVPLPNEEGRVDILTRLSRKAPIAKDVKISDIARRAKGCSGADLAAMLREATMLSLDDFREERRKRQSEEAGGGEDGEEKEEEGLSGKRGKLLKEEDGEELIVCSRHFMAALKKLPPSVTEKQNAFYSDAIKSVRANLKG